jgi:aspartate/methionine/tyrosine aminotransferase
MEQEYLFPSPPPPAIREAMAKAVDRKDQGLAVFDFSSGNIGNLLVGQTLFDKLDISASDSVAQELVPVVEGLARGLVDSFYPYPKGVAYSPTGGSELIRRLIVRYFREVHGIPLADDDTRKVIVTAGGQQAMTAALRSIKPGTRVLMPKWDYAPVAGILKYHNLEEVRVDVKDDLSIDTYDLKAKVKPNSVFYVSMPNNPTGYVSPEDLGAIVDVVSGQDGAVVWDAPYLFTLLRLSGKEATFDKVFLQQKVDQFKAITSAHHSHMCVLSSLSKTCLIAGLRFGFATASEQWVSNMEAIIGRENLSSPTSSFIIGTEIMKRFLDRPISYEWICRVLASRLTTLIREIGDHLLLPGNGMLGALYVPVLTGKMAARDFADRLVSEYGVVTVPGDQFFGGPAPAIRVSLVSVPWSESEEAWAESVAALKRALGDVHAS